MTVRDHRSITERDDAARPDPGHVSARGVARRYLTKLLSGLAPSLTWLSALLAETDGAHVSQIPGEGDARRVSGRCQAVLGPTHRPRRLIVRAATDVALGCALLVGGTTWLVAGPAVAVPSRAPICASHLAPAERDEPPGSYNAAVAADKKVTKKEVTEKDATDNTVREHPPGHCRHGVEKHSAERKAEPVATAPIAGPQPEPSASPPGVITPPGGVAAPADSLTPASLATPSSTSGASPLPVVSSTPVAPASAAAVPGEVRAPAGPDQQSGAPRVEQAPPPASSNATKARPRAQVVTPSRAAAQRKVAVLPTKVAATPSPQSTATRSSGRPEAAAPPPQLRDRMIAAPRMAADPKPPRALSPNGVSAPGFLPVAVLLAFGGFVSIAVLAAAGAFRRPAGAHRRPYS